MHSLVGDLMLVRFAAQPDKLLHRRLYNALRQAILDKSLAPQTRLPASRDLAAQLGISRNSVITVYEQLLAEGYVTSRQGSGTWVAQTLPDNVFHPQACGDALSQPATTPAFSRRGQQLLDNISASPSQWGAFIPGVPDVSAFPHQRFSKIQARISRRPAPRQLTYSNNGGSPALQQALVEYLRVARSVNCNAEQILIVEGVHQAIDLVTRMLTNPGDRAWIEEPSYWGIRHILQMNDVTLCPVDVDQAGMDPPDTVEEVPRLIFVTPSHQYPLGPVMSLERRQRLLNIAARHPCWIVEDDYDSEFRFSGQPIPALQGLVPDAPVIYIGTFSKTLYPGLRLGYLVLPPALAESFRKAHAELYRSGHSLIQTALAEFIESGLYTAHIRRMRLLYSKRRALLCQLIIQAFGPQALNDFNDNAGLHLILHLPGEADDVAIAAHANARGILVRALSRYYVGDKKRQGLLMGFASITEEQMPEAFERLMASVRLFCPHAFLCPKMIDIP